MIIKNKKLLFIHIPRTGGTSIEQSFGRPRCKEGINSLTQHNTLKQYSEKEDINSYFTFSFVRNPWDRLISWYLWSHADIIYYQYMADQGLYCSNKNPLKAWERGKKIMGEPSSCHINRKFYLKFKNSFACFIESLPSRMEQSLHAPDVNIHLNRENRLIGKWVMPQVEWLKNTEDEVGLNFIGKYENYETDVKKLFLKVKHSPKSLPIVGHILHKPNYQRFYTKKTQQMILDIYREDIEFFDYEF
jgi:hypothetical protein